MTSTPFRPTIHTQADLEDAWRHLMRPLGFDQRSLWLMLIDEDDRPLPQLTEVADLPDRPSGWEGRRVGHFLAMLSSSMPECRFAFLLTRPGRGGPDDADRAWAELLYDAAREAATACEVVHLANDDTVAPIPLDDLDLGEPIGA